MHCCLLNTSNAELNPICYFLALLEAHHILHVSRIRVKGDPSRFNKGIFFYPIKSFNFVSLLITL
jgi:hypothetical protein